MPEQFAYGVNTIDGESCPLVAAGYHPAEHLWTGDVAKEYDLAFGTIGYARSSGIAPEEDAKEAWFKAIDKLRERGMIEAAEKAQEVAAELGWKSDA